MRAEDVKDVPLVYPLIEVSIRTVAYVNGRPIATDGAEVINTDVSPEEVEAKVLRFVREFEAYIAKVTATAGSPEGQRELQNILDKHARPLPQLPEDSPSSQAVLTEPVEDTEPSDPRAA